MPADQESFVPLLIKRLTDSELTVRIHAGVQLGGLGVAAKPALSALMELGRSGDVHDRRLAILVLGSLGHDLTEAVPPLHHALQDDDEAVRRLAAEALEEIAPVRAQLKVA